MYTWCVSGLTYWAEGPAGTTIALVAHGSHVTSTCPVHRFWRRSSHFCLKHHVGFGPRIAEIAASKSFAKLFGKLWERIVRSENGKGWNRFTKKPKYCLPSPLDNNRMRNFPPTLLVLPPGRIALKNGEICRSYLVVIVQQVRSPDQDQVVYTLVKHQEDLKIFF